MVKKVKLSPQETVTLQYVAQGLSYKQVAQLMGIKENTVQSNLKRIREFYEKQGRIAPTQLHLLKRAIEDGIVPPIFPIGESWEKK